MTAATLVLLALLQAYGTSLNDLLRAAVREKIRRRCLCALALRLSVQSRSTMHSVDEAMVVVIEIV